jgi:fatty-acyl-CoA synthase
MESTMQAVPLGIPKILEHGARHFGDSRVSALYGDGVRTATFAQVRDRVARLAAGLVAHGVSLGDRVGSLAWNTLEHLECYFAVPSLGAILHTVNPRFRVEQIVMCLNDAGTSVIVVDDLFLGLLAQCVTATPRVRTVVRYRNGLPDDDVDAALAVFAAAGVHVLGYEELVAAHEPIPAWVDVPETAGAALCYTSGTTGDPKGVVYSHRSVWLHALLNTSGAQFGLSHRDTTLLAVPLFHVMGWNLPYSSFMVGSGLVLANRWNQPVPLLELVTSLRPTFAAGVPTVWNDMARVYDGEEETYDISSLTRMSVGGAVVPESLIRWWQCTHGVAVLHGCGMTETSATMTSGLPPQGFPRGEVAEHQRTQGRFLIGVQSRIVADDGSALPKDGTSAGELQLRGPWITGGYLGRDGDATPDGWLPTGDIATISPQGYLSYKDRKKDVIKSGGEWISSVALETHLTSHPAVRDAAVVAVDDFRWQERPAAILVAAGEPPSVEALRAHVAEAFPSYWVPDHWVFVDQLPRTSVGKFDKKVLRERYRHMGTQLLGGGEASTVADDRIT